MTWMMIKEVFKYDSFINPFLGAIGVEELEEPLLAFGLVDNREEVIALMSYVDDDLEITFPEFLSLISGAKGDKGNSGANLI